MALIGGERIGTAYIRVLADASGIDESIAKQMEDGNLDKVSEEHGRELQDAFDKGYTEQLNRNKTIEKTISEDEQNKLLGKFKALGELVGNGFDKEVSNAVKDLATRMGIDDKKAQQIGDRAGVNWASGLARGVDRVDLGSLFRKSFADIEKEAKKGDSALLRLGERIDNVGSKISRTFGRGNMFLNFMDSLVGAPFRVIGNLLTMFDKLGKKVGDFVNEIQQAEGWGQKISMVAGSLGEAAGALGLVGAGATVLIALLGPIAGMISALAAAVVALASSVAFALAAGLGVFAGLLPLVAAGFVTLYAAVKGAGLTTKGLAGITSQLKPLKEAWQDMQHTLGQGLVQAIHQVMGPLGRLVGLFRQFGFLTDLKVAMKDIGTSFGDLLRSPGMKQFMIAMGTELPVFFRQVGQIAANVLGGVAGLFRAALPITQDFLGWVTGVSQTFNDWANSAKGQTWLGKFFADAEKSAGSIWNLLSGIGDVLGQLLFSHAGQKAGNTIIDQMAGAFQNLAKFISKAQKDGSLAQWFQSGVDIAGQLGRMIMAVVNAFDTLDTPQNRKIAVEIFGLIADALELITHMIQALQPWWDLLGKALLFISEALRWVVHYLQMFVDWIGKGIKYAVDFAEKWGPKLWNGIVAGGQAIWRFAQKIPGWFETAWNAVEGAFHDTVNTIERWAGNIADFFRAIPHKIASFFHGLASSIMRAAGNLESAISGWIGRGISHVSAFVTRVVNFWRNLAGRIVNAAGNLASSLGRWFMNMVGNVEGYVTRTISFWRNLAGRIVSAAGNLASALGSWFQNMVGNVAGYVSNTIDKWRGLAGRIVSAAGNLASTLGNWFQQGLNAVTGIPGQIVDAFRGLGGKILDAIGPIDIGSLFKNIPGSGLIGSALGHIGLAEGGVVPYPMTANLAEHGPELVVPLTGPLSNVDPAVRELSRVLRGMPAQGSIGGYGQPKIGQITIVTPTKDPAAVAQETVNRLTAMSAL